MTFRFCYGLCKQNAFTVLFCIAKSLSRVWLFATPWTIAHQTPPSMEFFRQGYWSGLPIPSPGDLPNPGIELRSPALQADALPSEPPGNPSILDSWPLFCYFSLLSLLCSLMIFAYQWPLVHLLLICCIISVSIPITIWFTPLFFSFKLSKDPFYSFLKIHLMSCSSRDCLPLDWVLTRKSKCLC